MKTSPIQNLIQQFQKMPTIGAKTAERLAYYIINSQKNEVDKLIQSITQVKEIIKYCEICFNVSESAVCSICNNKARNNKSICIVEHPQDIVSIEKTNCYTGLYHVLHGVLSPMDGIGPKDIKIGELIHRIKNNENTIQEVIIATNPTANGEATAVYIKKTLQNQTNVKITRIGFGLAIGSDISYSDKSTLLKSFLTRTEL